MDDLIISVFYEIDNFCKKFIPYMEQQCIQTGDKPVPLELPSRLTLSEAMTICAVFHLSGYRTFKWFYQELVLKNYRKLWNLCHILHSQWCFLHIHAVGNVLA